MNRISLAAVANAMYSAFIINKLMHFCLYDDYNTWAFPTKKE